MEVVMTAGAIRHAKLQSNHHHKQTNIQFFTGRMPFLSPNQQCQCTEGKISHAMDLLTPSSPGVFQLCLWPLLAPGYLGEGCHVSHQPSDASTPVIKNLLLIKRSVSASFTHSFLIQWSVLLGWYHATSNSTQHSVASTAKLAWTSSDGEPGNSCNVTVWMYIGA